MIAKSLLVNGPARFLSTIYANDLNVGGGLAITGTINLAAGTSTSASLQINSKGALYGYDAWLRINEQKQFTSGVYFGTNIVRTDGSFQIGNAGANINLTTSAATFKVPINVNGTTYYWNTSGSINANAGTFVSLNSPKGVFTNMIVTDTLVATHQEIEHVANLGGVFLVTPTVKCISSGSGKTLTSLTVTAANITRTDSNGESITYNYTLAINDSAFSTATIGGNTWGQYGEVKVSGNINGVVLGTCKGFIQSINTTSHVLTVAIKYTGVQTPATPSDISTVVDLNVMLTTIYDSGNSRHNPVGIWMRSRDTNGYSHISLYGGTSEWPTVRIGNLTNLPDINGVTPDGWGIYTDHGFFSGVIVSTSGKIGNFTISSALYSSTHSDWNTNVDGIYIGSDYISFGKQGVTYFKPDGTGKIGAWTVSATALSNGTYGSDSSVFISTANMASKAIAGRTGADWRVTVGSHLGVTNTGALYANSGIIGGCSIDSNGNLQVPAANITGQLTASQIVTSGITIAQSQVTNLTTDLGNKANSSTVTAISNKVTAVYGTCNTAAGTQIKDVTCSNFTLFNGALITVTFSTANTYASGAVKLRINSSSASDAKEIWVDSAATSTTSKFLWGANACITFRYDGSHFIPVGEPRSWYGTSSTGASVATKVDDTNSGCSGCVVCRGTKVTLVMTNNNTTSSPKLNINGTGEIDLYGKGTTGPTTNNKYGWKSGSTVSFIFDGKNWRMEDTIATERAIDASTEASNAAKTATNFIVADSSGLMVADMSGGAVTSSTVTTRNVLIDSDSVNIRDGTTVVASYGETTTLGRDGMCQFHITGDELYGASPEGKIMFSVKPGFDRSTDLLHNENTGNIAVNNNSFSYTLKNTPNSTTVKVYGFLYFNEGETIVSKTPTWALADNNMVSWEGAGTIGYNGLIERSGNTFSISISNTNSNIDHAVFYFSYATTFLTPLSSMTFGTRTHYTMGQGSSTFGHDLTATGAYSFAEGIHNRATGEAAHVEGGGFSEEIDGYTYNYNNSASGNSSHAEGRSTIASGIASHAEGGWSRTDANYAHAECESTIADGYASHAEGGFSTAHGRYSHAQNYWTTASSYYQTTIGKCNIVDANDVYALIIGNGASNTNRSNALAVKWDGTVVGPMITYKANDTFTLTQYNLHGIISTASKDIILSLETEKDMSEITTVSVTALTGALRGVKGVIDSTSYNTNWLTGNVYTVTATKKSRRHVEVRIVRQNGAAFSNTTNETPVSLYATITLKFT